MSAGPKPQHSTQSRQALIPRASDERQQQALSDQLATNRPRPRLKPHGRRTFSRAPARASSRLATLTHAITTQTDRAQQDPQRGQACRQARRASHVKQPHPPSWGLSGIVLWVAAMFANSTPSCSGGRPVLSSQPPRARGCRGLRAWSYLSPRDPDVVLVGKLKTIRITRSRVVLAVFRQFSHDIGLGAEAALPKCNSAARLCSAGLIFLFEKVGRASR